MRQFKENRVEFPSVTNLEEKQHRQMRINANSSRISYVDPLLTTLGLLLILVLKLFSNTPPPGSIQFTISEVEEALLDLDANQNSPNDLEKMCLFVFSSSLLEIQQVNCDLRFF
jgi:hypothetical protein